ncbi:MAG: hypothetical protein COV67_08310 [Nitrospinae bacterium CG11_big_fil_rev_8_21_14_0_20_56_8]|nr:MAG: hypothetical protein COV67_08310 [Nitrospinae bacterium CG11_big_fil_rev_8_21_14_0_20_56_8]
MGESVDLSQRIHNRKRVIDFHQGTYRCGHHLQGAALRKGADISHDMHGKHQRHGLHKAFSNPRRNACCHLNGKVHAGTGVRDPGRNIRHAVIHQLAGAIQHGYWCCDLSGPHAGRFAVLTHKHIQRPHCVSIRSQGVQFPADNFGDIVIGSGRGETLRHGSSFIPVHIKENAGTGAHEQAVGRFSQRDIAANADNIIP